MRPLQDWTAEWAVARKNRAGCNFVKAKRRASAGNARTKPMANNKEEAGKGTPRPGDAPGARRTYATIDLTASEVEGRGRSPPAAASAASAASTAEAKSQGKPEAKSSASDTKSAGPTRPRAEGGARVADGLASLGARASL